jgi:hypothetical protein
MHPNSGTNFHMSGNQTPFLKLSANWNIPVLFGNGQALVSCKGYQAHQQSDSVQRTLRAGFNG